MKPQPTGKETTAHPSTARLEDLQKELKAVEAEFETVQKKREALADQEQTCNAAMSRGSIEGKPVTREMWQALLDRRNELRQELGDLSHPLYAQMHPLMRRRTSLLQQIESIRSREVLIASLEEMAEGLRA